MSQIYDKEILREIESIITFTGLVLLGLIEFPVKEKVTYLVDFFPSNCQVRLKL